MATTTMPVQDALNQLKIMRDRIAAATTRPLVATANPKGMVATLGISEAVFAARSAADLQSAEALIANYRALKRAINLSNATTEITVGGQKMTVAEAIDWKKSIEFAVTLRNKLTMDLTAAQRTIAQHQERIAAQAENAAQALAGEKQANAKEYEAVVTQYLERHGMHIVDAVSAQAVIDRMTAEIDAFRAEIDLALTVSNVTTNLTVDLV